MTYVLKHFIMWWLFTTINTIIYSQFLNDNTTRKNRSRKNQYDLFNMFNKLPAVVPGMQGVILFTIMNTLIIFYMYTPVSIFIDFCFQRDT